MKKGIIAIIVIVCLLLLIGGGVFTLLMWRAGWDVAKLSNVDYIEESASFEADEVTSFTVELGTKDVYVVQSEDDKITVQYYSIKTKKGVVLSEVVPTITDGALLCKEEVKNRSVMVFDFHKDEKLVIKVPADKVADYSLKVSTGNIVFGEADKVQKVGSLAIEASTGNVTMVGNTLCEKELTLGASTGNLKITGRVECAGAVNAKASTGNISVSGALKGENVTFETSTGKVKVTSPMTFHALNITTSTGDVSVLVAGSREQYRYLYETSTGDSNMPEFIFGEKQINIHTSTGDIDLSFAE